MPLPVSEWDMYLAKDNVPASVGIRTSTCLNTMPLPVSEWDMYLAKDNVPASAGMGHVPG